MGMIVVGLMKDPHEARGIVRALEADGFELEDIDLSGGMLTELLSRGVPEKEANLYAEGVRRGGMLVFVRAQDDDEAAEAAELMATHGAVDLDACATGWQPDVVVEEYALVFGEYPAAPGRIYHDPRSTSGTRYDGPERRARDEPYAGVNRRAI
jgi:hypothetical protein